MSQGRSNVWKLRNITNVLDPVYGAKGDGATSDTAAIQAAIDALEALEGGDVFLPAGSYPCQGLSSDDNSRVRLVGEGRGTELKKNANGAVITLGAECELQDLYINGQGATYTGVAVAINTGGLNLTSWRRIHGVTILDTESYAIEFTGNRAGYATQISHCHLQPRTETVAAVKFPTNGSVLESNGNRSLTDVFTGSNPIVDLAYSNDSQIVNCQGGVPSNTVTSAKAVISGCRLVQPTGAGGWTIGGSLHSITGNTVSLTAGTNTITFDSSCAGVHYAANASASATITDNSNGSAGGNHLYLPNVTTVPTWTSTAGATTLGNGTLNGAHQRQGARCNFNIQFTWGSTTSVAAGGIWKFSLPYTPARDEAVSVWIWDDTPTALYVGTGMIFAGTAEVWVIVATDTAGWVNQGRPITWATSDRMRIAGTFTIQ